MCRPRPPARPATLPNNNKVLRLPLSRLPRSTPRGLARRVADAFYGGRLDLSGRYGAPVPGWEAMPEVVAVARLKKHGWDAARRRLFLTFVAAMDRARDADRLWRVSTKLALEHPWAFDPTEIGRRGAELDDLLRRSGVSQRHSDDIGGWKQIGQSLAARENAPAVYDAIHMGRGDARVLLRELRRVRNGAPVFRFLRGPKIGPMWVRMLAAPGEADIQSIDALPVAVDVQVRKITEYLRVLDSRGQDLEDVRAPIQQAWRHDVELSGTGGPESIADTCAALDPALWFFAKWGCTYCERAGHRLPISDICGDCSFSR